MPRRARAAIGRRQADSPARGCYLSVRNGHPQRAGARGGRGRARVPLHAPQLARVRVDGRVQPSGGRALRLAHCRRRAQLFGVQPHAHARTSVRRPPCSLAPGRTVDAQRRREPRRTFRFLRADAPARLDFADPIEHGSFMGDAAGVAGAGAPAARGPLGGGRGGARGDSPDSEAGGGGTVWPPRSRSPTPSRPQSRCLGSTGSKAWTRAPS